MTNYGAFAFFDIDNGAAVLLPVSKIAAMERFVVPECAATADPYGCDDEDVVSRIVSIMSNGYYCTESVIRASVGDNPNTSKKLRALVNKGIVVRTGKGGRSEPYMYTVVF
jgi:hypothetical protein